jgi:hypothetical protein
VRVYAARTFVWNPSQGWKRPKRDLPCSSVYTSIGLHNAVLGHRRTVGSVGGCSGSSGCGDDGGGHVGYDDDD